MQKRVMRRAAENVNDIFSSECNCKLNCWDRNQRVWFHHPDQWQNVGFRMPGNFL